MKRCSTPHTLSNRRHSLSGKGTWETWQPFVIAAILLRLLLTAVPAYAIDMGGYVGWSRYLADSGPAGLYERFHVVYAPLFHYCLWLTGEVANLLGFSTQTHAYAIKLWSVTADAAGAWLLILYANRTGRQKAAYPFALLYFLNPAVLFDSSVWGQFDGIPATMLLGVLMLFLANKPVPAAWLFVAAVLVKPQSGLLAPLVLLLFLRDVSTRPWRRALACWVAALSGGIGLYLVVVLPFYAPTPLAHALPQWADPFWWLFDLYLRSMQDYPYGTANAWNLWYLLGGQIRPDAATLFGLSHALWGGILLLPFAGISLWLGSRSARKADHAMLSAWLLLFSAYMMMTKMHERYLVPALLIGTAAALTHRALLKPLLLASSVSFVNMLVMYVMSFSENYWLPPADLFSLSGSAAMTLAFGWTCILLWRETTTRHNPRTMYAHLERRSHP